MVLVNQVDQQVQKVLMDRMDPVNRPDLEIQVFPLGQEYLKLQSFPCHR